MNVLINVSERRFHLNNVNFYVKNHGSVNTNGKGSRIYGEKLQDFVKQQQDYERGGRIAERELERDRLAAEEAKADKERELERDRIAAQEKERADKIAAQEKEREDKLAAQEKDREIELAKIAAQEKERADKLAAQEKDREIEFG